MQFVTNLGKVQEFNERGSSPTQYDLLNLQPGNDGKIHFKIVGSFDSPSGEGLNVNETDIWWNNENQEVRDYCFFMFKISKVLHFCLN